MNSILHTCTHSNDDDTFTRMSEDQMYGAIFKYIEHLFEIIKPNQVFYMAIDGVAPRAKMNQQRARRFRTAFEAEENLKKAIEKGQEIPKDDPFDSNSITPGTEFMAKLTDNLKYFIHKKISEDSNWANVKIILSGHEVPGEGEHKIMDYIRSMKSQDDYNPNTRHCIYGLDADLIMLGLVTHDTHFALLREEVTFGPRSNSKSNELSDQRFFLLHLSLLREYLSLEFQELDNQLNFEYDFERVLDDFILIMYVIGNDFLPNLPDLFINKGAFPLIIETFKQALKESDGYLNENGTINLKRLNIWLHYLSEFELENFEKQDVDVEWFNKRLEDISISGEKKRERTGKLVLLKDQKKLVGFIKPWFLEVSSKKVSDLINLDNEGKLPILTLPKEETEKYIEFIKQFALDVGFIVIHSRSQDTYQAKLDIDGLSPYETDEEYEERLSNIRKTIKKYQSANLFETEELLAESKDIYDSKFLNWKDKYYKEKLKFSIYDTDEMIDLTQHYLEGLQWVLYYYYTGCPSWNWFYKYHYAPRISDISIGLDELLKSGKNITFNLSKPFKPFEQLMAVLPARSRKLMPLPYRPLMTEPHSPIIDFYPHQVDIDMNGKTASWEAVVLLSFVDENRLIEALKSVESKLTPEEKRRNTMGTDIEFIHNPQIDYVYPSPLPAFFHDIEHDKCYEATFLLPKVNKVKIGLTDGAKLGKELLAGFPTLDTIPFESKLMLNEVKVFQNPTRSESMILTIDNIWKDLSVHQFAEKFLNKVAYSKWPFLRESKIIKVTDSEFKYEVIKSGNSKKIISTPLDNDEFKTFNQRCREFLTSYDKTKGIRLGEVYGLVEVQPVTGIIRNSKGAYVKTFSKQIETYPIQMIVEEVSNEDERFATRPPLPIDEEFPIDSQVVFLGDMGYGSSATVVGYNDQKTTLSIRISKIQTSAEPNIGRRRFEIEKREIKYYPSFDVAKKLKINPLFLSKITSGYMIEDAKGRKVNIGLELKFEARRMKVLGFTKKSGKFWEYSPLAIQLLSDYKQKFPTLFNNLLNYNSKSMPALREVSNEKELEEVRKWLKEAKSQMNTVSLESESLTKFSFQAIEDYIEDYVNSPIAHINKDIKGVPKEAIFNPSDSYQLLTNQRFELGDRVVYVQDFGKVPKLTKGTVVSINTIINKTTLGIIFDIPLISGNTMNGKLRTNRGLLIDSSLVLNLTNKQMVYHSKASRDRVNVKAKQPKSRTQQQEPTKKKVFTKAPENKAPESKAPGATSTTNKSKDFLNLLQKDKKSQQDKVEEEDAYVDSSAIRKIYGQIYSNVLSEGLPAPPPQPQNYGIPIVPGIPIPPQYYQMAPPPVDNSERQDSNQSRTNNQSQRGRGGRGRGRGRGNASLRGRGKPVRNDEKN